MHKSREKQPKSTTQRQLGASSGNGVACEPPSAFQICLILLLSATYSPLGACGCQLGNFSEKASRLPPRPEAKRLFLLVQSEWETLQTSAELPWEKSQSQTARGQKSSGQAGGSQKVRGSERGEVRGTFPAL